MLAGFILALMLVMDCFAFNLISKDKWSSRRQKILQMLLVVFVPLLGSLLVIFVNKAKPASNGNYPNQVELDNGGELFKASSKNEVDLGGSDSD